MRKIAPRRFSAVASALFAVVLISPIAAADDADDVRSVVDEYLATEGDLANQAKLMTDDRSFIAGGFRQTNNVNNMKNQTAAAMRNKELDPDTRLSVTGEDIIPRNRRRCRGSKFLSILDRISQRRINSCRSQSARAAERCRYPGSRQDGRQLEDSAYASNPDRRQLNITQTKSVPQGAFFCSRC